jgi:hypothetical protein
VLFISRALLRFLNFRGMILTSQQRRNHDEQNPHHAPEPSALGRNRNRGARRSVLRCSDGRCEMKSGTFDAFNLLYNVRRILPEGMNKAISNWALACEIFAVGSTSAIKICRDAGIDPHSRIVNKVPPTPPEF